MYTLQEQIEHELFSRASYEKEHRKLMFALADNDDETSLEQAQALENRLAVTDEWLSFLTPEQYLVVRQHLVAGRSWRCVEVEYYRSFGADEAVSIDMLMHIQHTAIEQIARNMDQETFGLYVVGGK